MSRFSEASTWEKLKGAAILSPLAVGAFLGATAMADSTTRDFSEERVAEIETGIAYMDGKARAVIGEENPCQTAIYNYLRDENDFPSVYEEIQETLTASCEEEPYPSDETIRLLGSYVTDLDILNQGLRKQRDAQHVSIVDRLIFAVGVGSGGGIISMGLMAIDDKVQARKRQTATINE